MRWMFDGVRGMCGWDVCEYQGDQTHPMNNRMMKVMKKRRKSQTRSKVVEMWNKEADAS